MPRGRTDGNLAVVQGALARALGIVRARRRARRAARRRGGTPVRAVRLGRVEPQRAQLMLLGLAPALEAAAVAAVDATSDGLRATAPELDVMLLAHRRADARMFTT